jgi:hypothetical protein
VIPLDVLAYALQKAQLEGRVEALVKAIITAHQLKEQSLQDFPTGRCSCETQGWGVWDWQFWAYECWTPRPVECDMM